MALLLAILPPVLIAYYIYQKDKYDKEPKRLIIKSFMLGCLGIIPALFLEIICNQSLFSNLFLYVFFGIALIEEGVKFFFLKKYMYNEVEFNEPMDGIVYAVMISLGFATVENISYVLNNKDQEINVAIIRMFTAIPLHAVCGVILGYFVGLAKFSKKENLLFYKGLFLATLVHTLYNYFIFLGYNFIFSILALITAIYYSKKAINLHQEDSKNRNHY
ncbi:MAG: PrsW family intramembrane metalloprotease [Flavobacteriaceae bacterium]|nr:PrsW family intramembrane metalloprotease [Flavobacteriaceae bacterium]|tara:strand:- start:717 stop:1370 length:654 start_codon:yes stop_codon:yes gene_type:complete